MAVRLPAGMQFASENSHSAPLAKLLLGQAAPPSVVAVPHTPVLGLHGPSPVEPGSSPPAQVWNTLGSLKDWPSGPAKWNGSWLATLEHVSKWPISCCISTPPSRAAQGTWFCCLALLYSAWKSNGVP